MAVLVADSGGTKTDWALIDPTEKTQFLVGRGLNPLVKKDEIVSSELHSIQSTLVNKDLDAIFFFGAGCRHPKSKARIRELIGEVFEKTGHIEISEDILGAGKALFGDGDGWIVVLGTGSNASYMSNGQLKIVPPNLGYILGDEGSGADLGKRLIQGYIHNRLSPELAEAMQKAFPDQDQIIADCYKSDYPQQYLSSFVSIMQEHKHEVEVLSMVEAAFMDFVRRYMVPYAAGKPKEVGAVGSIASIFSRQLEQALATFGFQMTQVEQKPITKLAAFFRNKYYAAQ